MKKTKKPVASIDPAKKKSPLTFYYRRSGPPRNGLTDLAVDILDEDDHVLALGFIATPDTEALLKALRGSFNVVRWTRRRKGKLH